MSSFKIEEERVFLTFSRVNDFLHEEECQKCTLEHISLLVAFELTLSTVKCPAMDDVHVVFGLGWAYGLHCNMTQAPEFTISDDCGAMVNIGAPAM